MDLFGTIVELWWNFGGTLVELWWNFEEGFIGFLDGFRGRVERFYEKSTYRFSF